MGQWWPAAGLGVLSVAVHAWDLLTEATIIFITSTTVWPQVNSREGTQLHPSTENWIKDLLSMAMVFPVVMYGCESWTVKKAERRRIDAFEV